MTYRTHDETVQLIARAGRAGADHDRDVPEIDLLSPLTIRGVTFRNRIAMSPMCQYSALVFIAREMLRESYWALKAQQPMGEEPAWPIQYGYVLKRRAK